MSDIAPAAEPVAEPAAAEPVVVDPAAPVVEPAAEPAAPEVDPFDDTATDKFDRSYVEKLRAENAKHRTAAKSYSDVFERFDEPSRDVLLDLARTIADDPAAGAARMKELAALLEGTPAAEPEPDPNADKPLTRAEYDKIEADKATKAADAAEQAKIGAEVEGLGYTLGTREHFTLLWEASHNHKGDLPAAHKALEAERQGNIDAFLEQKRKDAEGTPTAGSGGGAPAHDSPIKDFASARRATEERAKAAGFRV